MNNENNVIYVRSSNEKALQKQLDACVRYCNKNNYDIIMRYKEGGPATPGDTTFLDEMIEYIEDCHESDNIKRLVVYDFDRLTRDINTYVKIKKRLNDCGVEIISVSCEYRITPEQRFQESIENVFYQYKIDCLEKYGEVLELESDGSPIGNFVEYMSKLIKLQNTEIEV